MQASSLSRIISAKKPATVSSFLVIAFLALLTLSTSLPTVQASVSNNNAMHPRPGAQTLSALPLIPGCSGKCPTGLADYGVNGGSPYSYNASGFQSTTTISKLTIGASSGSNPGVSLQLNAVAYGVVEGKSTGEYWTQDVAAITQSGTSYTISVLDNIWNFTGYPNKNMAGTVKGCGGTSYSNEEFYYCYGPSVTTTLPFKIVLQMYVGSGSTFSSCGTSSAVKFSVKIYHGATLLASSTYDTVCFSSSKPSSPHYMVGGLSPYGTYNDIENVLGGNCCSQSVQITAISATMKLDYAMSTASKFVTVPHAWSAGYDTAETASNVKMSMPKIDTGKASSGADSQVQLW